MSQIPAIDLFAGAGGLSLGATSAGAEVRLMVDNDPLSVATARSNPCWHEASALELDVADVSGAELRERAGVSRSGPLLVVGGPPCQPFSKAAYWTDPGDDARYRRARARGHHAQRPAPILEPRPDARRSLIDEFWRLVVESDADAFLFENVASILHPRNRQIVPALMGAAESQGFDVSLVKANAAEYGVPQVRKRVFVLGSRGGAPVAPARTHALDGNATGLAPAVTAGEALQNFMGEEFFEEGEVVAGRWADHLKEIPPGWNYKHHTAWAGHPSPTFEAETRFWSFLLKLDPDRPSWTVAASPGPWTGPFHWESRRLRTTEMAALQAFPFGYKFVGSRRERIRQIGNAVPPPMAAVMVKSVLATLEKRRAVA